MTARTRRSRDLLARLRADRGLTRTPQVRPGSHRARPEGASGFGTIPRLSRPCCAASLTRYIALVSSRSPACASPPSPSPSPSSPALGMIVPSVSGGRRRPEGRDHRRGDPRRDGRLPGRCRRRLRRGAQVHLERHQGLQPERDLGQGQGRGRRRVDRHLHGPRQRLAEPVHLRPAVHDQGRLRAQRDGRGGRLQQQVLRRAVHGEHGPRARARSCSSTTCATPRATPSRATPSRASTVARQRADNYAHGLPEGRRLGRHRRRPRRRRALPARAVHDPPVDRGHVAHDAEPERQRRHVRVDADAGRHGLPGSRHPDIGLLPLAGDRHHRGHDRRGHLGRLRRHRREPDRPRDPRQRRGLDRGRRPLQRPRHAGRPGRDASRRDPRSASSSSPPR